MSHTYLQRVCIRVSAFIVLSVVCLLYFEMRLVKIKRSFVNLYRIQMHSLLIPFLSVFYLSAQFANLQELRRKCNIMLKLCGVNILKEYYTALMNENLKLFLNMDPCQ